MKWETAAAGALAGVAVALLVLVPGAPPVLAASAALGAVLFVFVPVRRAPLEDPREGLVLLLRLAYSGELAAGLAYAGHWRSVSSPDERDRIARIEEEEWHHRRLVGGLLETLGASPSPLREFRARIVGRTLGALCHVSGHFLPMYGAGRLESRNIVEYEDAAAFAVRAGHPEFVSCLLEMAEVEWEHEAYFRERTERSVLAKIVPVWKAPPPKESIRAAYAPAKG
jgi:demethoxyubiquinone hydroxylase (CLK1/Coq7/Cat5 family)